MKKQHTNSPHHSERIVIVGGGFAGVTLAQCLERLLPTTMEIVVLSAENHLVFTPMLPEVVGRTISPLHIVVACGLIGTFPCIFHRGFECGCDPSRAGPVERK